MTAVQRIAFLALILTMSAVAAVPKGNADNYPSRPIRLIVGFPPGSAADITARLIGDVMSRTLGQQVVVEARPGAGSNIAAEIRRAFPSGRLHLVRQQFVERDQRRYQLQSAL
jgi:tripartite-type tricarboxylate transporter receptor subunit TctC